LQQRLQAVANERIKFLKPKRNGSGCLGNKGKEK
jgi:hypothetical protein